MEDNTDKFVAHLRRTLSTVVPEEVEAIAELAASYAPVDTGALRDSVVGVIEATGEVVEGVVASDSEYAVFAHEGLGSHRVAHKFIERAMREHNEEMRERVGEGLNEL